MCWAPEAQRVHPLLGEGDFGSQAATGQADSKNSEARARRLMGQRSVGKSRSDLGHPGEEKVTTWRGMRTSLCIASSTKPWMRGNGHSIEVEVGIPFQQAPACSPSEFEPRPLRQFTCCWLSRLHPRSFRLRLTIPVRMPSTAIPETWQLQPACSSSVTRREATVSLSTRCPASSFPRRTDTRRKRCMRTAIFSAL